MSEMEQFKSVMKKLQGPGGCPWDSVQTFESMKKCCIEEAAEVVGAVNLYEGTGDYENLKEELGDQLMVLVLYSLIAEGKGLFTFDDVVKSAREKMIRRHPNVFGDVKDMTVEEQRKLWDRIKAEEKEKKNPQIDAYLPKAFTESKFLIDKAMERKGYEKEQ